MTNALFGGATLAIGLLLSSSASAYRTGADLSELAGTARVRWHKDSVEFVVNRNIPSDVDLDTLLGSVRQGFDVWSQPACGLLSLRGAGTTLVDGSPGDNVNTVQWLSSGWAGRGF